ncbi:glutamate 5-kinase [Paraurantiacibacter namhicola]|uniref:Glutamate 5-kinase n=1 Tax=Paraurantiacibacter namhicola TaxID=645517 RepID=A0A1C7DB38_9SPHN|nr:glutamate 5-kinase [Paraurantiacibacter namhicola]ANU08531.1 Glutamate 5-kinase [Paraurantiacibacter namhicola]
MAIETLPDFLSAEKCGRLVIKIGSALLIDDGGDVRCEWLRSVITEVKAARDRGQDVVIVSSGSIALGAARLGVSGGGRRTLSEAQACAAVGQIALAGAWAELLWEQGLVAAQMLLTLDDLEERSRYLNISATFSRLLGEGVVPVVNENDTIATDEIRFGDNDRLAARTAQACTADGVILLTDVDGLYDRHPAQPGAQRLPEVRGVTEEIHRMAGGESGSGVGTGGMTAKLLAAELAERAGIALSIMDGTPMNPIGRTMETGGGTLFLPKRDDSGRRAWIGGRLRFAGALTVDEGCVRALEAGKSLLAAGITGVTGRFERGDVLPIHAPDGRMVAKGIVEYGHEEAAAILGKSIEDQQAILGHAPRSCVVHRDHLVLL